MTKTMQKVIDDIRSGRKVCYVHRNAAHRALKYAGLVVVDFDTSEMHLPGLE
jgi:hypothetical protein